MDDKRRGLGDETGAETGLAGNGAVNGNAHGAAPSPETADVAVPGDLAGIDAPVDADGQTVAAPMGSDDRDDHGRFKPGWQGGPGRPRAKRLKATRRLSRTPGPAEKGNDDFVDAVLERIESVIQDDRAEIPLSVLVQAAQVLQRLRPLRGMVDQVTNFHFPLGSPGLPNSFNPGQPIGVLREGPEREAADLLAEVASLKAEVSRLKGEGPQQADASDAELSPTQQGLFAKHAEAVKEAFADDEPMWKCPDCARVNVVRTYPATTPTCPYCGHASPHLAAIQAASGRGEGGRGSSIALAVDLAGGSGHGWVDCGEHATIADAVNATGRVRR